MLQLIMHLSMLCSDAAGACCVIKACFPTIAFQAMALTQCQMKSTRRTAYAQMPGPVAGQCHARPRDLQLCTVRVSHQACCSGWPSDCAWELRSAGPLRTAGASTGVDSLCVQCAVLPFPIGLLWQCGITFLAGDGFGGAWPLPEASAPGSDLTPSASRPGSRSLMQPSAASSADRGLHQVGWLLLAMAALSVRGSPADPPPTSVTASSCDGNAKRPQHARYNVKPGSELFQRIWPKAIIWLRHLDVAKSSLVASIV